MKLYKTIKIFIWLSNIIQDIHFQQTSSAQPNVLCQIFDAWTFWCVLELKPIFSSFVNIVFFCRCYLQSKYFFQNFRTTLANNLMESVKKRSF